MSDESYTFTAARARLDEIVAQVRKKDVSLEASLDLLEEGVKLANQCTELIDHVDRVTAETASAAAVQASGEEAVSAQEDGAETRAEEEAPDDDAADSDQASAETGTEAEASDDL